MTLSLEVDRLSCTREFAPILAFLSSVLMEIAIFCSTIRR